MAGRRGCKPLRAGKLHLRGNVLTGEQIRAARGLGRLEQSDLAQAAEISIETVKRLERARGPISANTGTEAAIRRAFSDVGVIFIDENGEGPGVRLRKSAP
jgi:transcriptional regulator with XRE-family HTH domain